MRELGRELGVEAMSLYHHVSGKEDLLDGVVDLVLSEIELPDPGLPWDEWARGFAAVYRQIAIDHPHVFPLIALRPLATPEAFRPVEMSLDVFGRAGFGARDALAAFQTLADFTSGFALEEIAAAGGESSSAWAACQPDAFPRLREFAERPMRREVSFSRGLDIIVAGLAQHLGRQIGETTDDD
jgi:AcrR family transcriptional regulator